MLGELVDETADYLLFVGEAPPPARIVPRAGFARRSPPARPGIGRGGRFASST